MFESILKFLGMICAVVLGVLAVREMAVDIYLSPFWKFIILVVCLFFLLICIVSKFRIIVNGFPGDSCDEDSYVDTYMQKRAIECASVCVVCTVIAFLLMLLGGVYGIVEGKI